MCITGISDTMGDTMGGGHEQFEPDMMNTMATTSDMGSNEWKEPEPGSTVSFNWEDIEVESDIKLVQKGDLTS